MPKLSLLQSSTGSLLLLCGALLPAVAQEGGNALISRLSHDYHLAHPTLTSKGNTALSGGEVFTLRRGGVHAYSAENRGYEEICPVRVQGGSVQNAATGLCVPAGKGGHRILASGEHVCITAINMSGNEAVTLRLVTCGGAGAELSHAYYAMAYFHLPAGGVSAAEAGKVESAINLLLARGGSHAEPEAESAPAKEKAASTAQAPKAPSAQSSAPKSPLPKTEESSNAASSSPAEPVKNSAKKHAAKNGKNAASGEAVAGARAPEAELLAGGIRKGASVEEVKTQLGEAEKTVALGKKLILVYPTVKVVLIDGKVESSSALTDAPTTAPGAAAATEQAAQPASSTPAEPSEPAATVEPASAPPASATPREASALPAPPPPAPVAEPASAPIEQATASLPGGVHKGESQDELRAALGEPVKSIAFGNKTILIYPGNLRVILIDGKVDGAEQQESEP